MKMETSSSYKSARFIYTFVKMQFKYKEKVYLKLDLQYFVLDHYY